MWRHNKHSHVHESNIFSKINRPKTSPTHDYKVIFSLLIIFLVQSQWHHGCGIFTSDVCQTLHLFFRPTPLGFRQVVQHVDCMLHRTGKFTN